MTYLIEIQNPSGPLAYVVAQAETRDAACVLIDAQLDDANDDSIIVAVHTIH